MLDPFLTFPVVDGAEREDWCIYHFFELRYFDGSARRLMHNGMHKIYVLNTTYESMLALGGGVMDGMRRLKNNEANVRKHLSKCSIEHAILLWSLLNFVDPASFVHLTSATLRRSTAMTRCCMVGEVPRVAG